MQSLELFCALIALWIPLANFFSEMTTLRAIRKNILGSLCLFSFSDYEVAKLTVSHAVFDLPDYSALKSNAKKIGTLQRHAASSGGQILMTNFDSTPSIFFRK